MISEKWLVTPHKREREKFSIKIFWWLIQISETTSYTKTTLIDIIKLSRKFDSTPLHHFIIIRHHHLGLSSSLSDRNKNTITYTVSFKKWSWIFVSVTFYDEYTSKSWWMMMIDDEGGVVSKITVFYQVIFAVFRGKIIIIHHHLELYSIFG